MDERDSAIIRELQLNARQSNRELARRVGLAPSSCLERVRQLEAGGVLRGYRAEVDLAKLNRAVQALIATQIRPLSRTVIDAFQAWAATLPEVLDVYVLAGSDDFLVHIAVPSNEHLHAFLIDSLAQRREVISFRTQVIYQHTATSVIAALPAGPATPPRRGAASRHSTHRR